MNAFVKARYQVSQRARVAFYLAHYLAARRAEPKRASDVARRKPLPARAALQRAMDELFALDWRNIADGLYAMPHQVVPSAAEARLSRKFLSDARLVAERRIERRARDLPADAGAFPAYYLQNFHYQTGGWLTDESAELYDFQVEALFNGTADAMRRQALVPLRAALAGRDQRNVSLLDVACGTGRFLTFVLDNYPKLAVTALDLSPAYLARARGALAEWRHVDFVRANAESIPLADASQDIVTMVYLFHELPPPVRRAVAREVARVLKPGGSLIFVESLQLGDVPEFDGLLEAFPKSFHEPYYLSFIAEDLDALWAEAGLRPISSTLAYLSKVSVFARG